MSKYKHCRKHLYVIKHCVQKLGQIDVRYWGVGITEFLVNIRSVEFNNLQLWTNMF